MLEDLELQQFLIERSRNYDSNSKSNNIQCMKDGQLYKKLSKPNKPLLEEINFSDAFIPMAVNLQNQVIFQFGQYI